MSGPAPAGMILAQRYGQAAMGATPYSVRQTPSYSYQSSYYTPPAAPVRRYSPSSPVLSITRYASRSTPPPPRPGFERINFNAAAPAVLTDEQSALLCARLDLVGSAEATGGLLASQARVRQNAVAAFAEVLNVPENQVDRHVRGTSVVIRDVIAAILTAERQPFPCAVQMVKLIQDFIAAVRRRHPSRVQPANAPRGPGPGPDPGAGGAAALVAIAQTEGGDAQPIHQQSFGTIETPITAENAETHVDTSVGGGQETPSQIPSPVIILQTLPQSPLHSGRSSPANVSLVSEAAAIEQSDPAAQTETAPQGGVTTQATAGVVTEEGAAAGSEQEMPPPQTQPQNTSPVTVQQTPPSSQAIAAGVLLLREGAAVQGDADAQYNLGNIYASGRGVTQDHVRAMHFYQQAAMQGHPYAQAALATMYATGQGGGQNDILAAHWYRQAAEQGNSEAQYRLGQMYATGQGVERNETEATSLYRQAAGNNHLDAQFNLGVCYSTGRGVPREELLAVRWLRQAAEQGHSLAQYRLGNMYANGIGVEMNHEEAMHLFRQAAYQGNADAQYCLGAMYANGCAAVAAGFWQKMTSWVRLTGAGKDETHDELAADWLRRAAEQGHAEAQYVLGMWYVDGRGVEQDQQQAYAWLSTAVFAGHAQAIEESARILAQLTPAAQDEAKRLAASYLEKYLLKK